MQTRVSQHRCVLLDAITIISRVIFFLFLCFLAANRRAAIRTRIAMNLSSIWNGNVVHFWVGITRNRPKKDKQISNVWTDTLYYLLVAQLIRRSWHVARIVRFDCYTRPILLCKQSCTFAKTEDDVSYELNDVAIMVTLEPSITYIAILM